MKKALFYDVMSGDRFVCTMRYDYLPCFGVKLEEIYAQLRAKRPSLRSKRFSIFIDEFQFEFEPAGKGCPTPADKVLLRDNNNLYKQRS